ncbi:MAG TPA: helix-turn-helix transcriptional regulator [Pseudonocardiaceae bacterium]|jgi:DNA-binding transcriptional ArsR family regulator|nr:helix-turn-helix transcriptional regulator [Pseudonocardiaceae bacterium]
MNTSRETIAAGGEVDFGAPAELIGHPARSAMLVALLDRRALPMSMLAGEAGVSPSTASAHLTRLVDGGLLRVRQQGRHRYYELASPAVADALESLARLAPARPVRSLRADSRARALRLARSCYDHLAGNLGIAVLRSLLAEGAIRGGDGRHHPEQARHDRLSAPGKDIGYWLTDTGQELLDRLGAALPPTRRRVVAYCVDWTEQRHHLGGAAGAALLKRFRELDWLHQNTRGIPRALTVTEAGKQGFADFFDISPERLVPPIG